MTRIVSGRWGGRRLRTPKGDGTRPTSDRVREAMFSSLESMLGGFEDVRVLDLFAGSGALALEALSRGALGADLVESDRRAAAVVAANIRELSADARLHRTTAQRFVAGEETNEYDLVFLDPPYATTTDEIHELLRTLRRQDCLTHGLAVVERSSRTPFTWPDGFEAVRDKAYGETHLWYGR
ncbi:16S rRNA (guanine(966)-N(2))-methyltransferase RsmD [Aeromicrobium terrae]|uniref:16S rRNA (Guanine(966)-N(2))-methyltransferase RsmD n=1 Tax=Aeromicrobium terrae TaxID=2498846 RepID=A0A5C8NNN8_9ACTN|nr:16S rRNA (guanine(966)-N(2))-methyltransferase RsmD [Aeromicrobium terrae]TXL62710.1 16S rRNA (guanine(966)-N(2))-methyltransferase RsmD [Aeromicrobium terrae]